MKTIVTVIFLVLQVEYIYGQSAWFKVDTDLDKSLEQIFFLTEEIGWAYSSIFNPPTHSYINEIHRTTNGGKNWASTTIDLVGQMFFTSQDTGWIIGETSSGNWPNIKYEDFLFRTTDGGESWSIIFSDTTHRFDAIFFVNGQSGLMFCYDEKFYMYKSSDGGETWTQSHIDVLKSYIADTHFVNDSVAICCYQGIFKTYDSGKTWHEKQAWLGYGDFHRMFFINEKIGWAVGMAIYKTVDGGETWFFQKKLGEYTLFGNTAHDCYFVNENIGWVSGSENMIYTTDGGDTWTDDSTVVNNYYNEYWSSSFFINENIGYALDSGELHKTTTGGIIASVNQDVCNSPATFKLLQNYPNPFNSSTTIHFSLPKSEHISLKIYNITGQEVAELMNDIRSAGEHQVQWKAGGLPGGAYLVVLQCGISIETQKLIIQK